jgi:hypothetical protein
MPVNELAMNGIWLEQYFLKASTDPKSCTRWGCTTCGNANFIRDICIGLGLRSPRYWQWDEDTATALTQVLAQVRPWADWGPAHAGAQSHSFKFFAFNSMRNLLSRVCPTLGQDAVAAILRESWAGNVLKSMQRHSAEEAKRDKERALELQLARERRAEKKKAAQEKHLIRLEQKKERDRLWRESHMPLGL